MCAGSVLRVTVRVLPMFPLGAVLFPEAAFPIHVFEPRYRELAETCLRGDGQFGVVLIERGHEVGGGDTRFGVGTVARIVEAARTPDGRFLLACVGEARLRITRWLDDDPYPRAEVEVLERHRSGPDGVAETAERRAEVERLLTRVGALRAELGERGPAVAGAPLPEDPERASFVGAARAPIGSFDAQVLLEVDDPVERLDRLVTMLRNLAEFLELRLAAG